MKRKYICFLILFAIFFFPSKVEAYNVIDNDCLKDNSCMLMCNYTNTYEATEGYGVTSRVERQRSISIYYYFDSRNWEIKWQSTAKAATVYKKGLDAFNDIFSKSGTNVFLQNSLNVDTFTCPKNGYLDFSSLAGNNELCFDDDGKTCRENYSNIGTSFGKGGGFKSTAKDFDFEEDINRYLDEWSIGDISCDDIYNGTFDLENSDQISKKVEDDFIKNYLHGNDLPKFIKNIIDKTDVKTRAEESARSKINECRKKIEEDLENGDITEDEATQRNDTLDNIDPEKVGDNVDNALNKLRVNNASLDNLNNDIECEDIFKIDEEGSVGWILQKILDYIKVIGPIIVVLLSAIDFISAIFSSDDKAMKQAQNKLIIRLIAAAALFLVPTLVELLLSLINGINNATCGFH